MYSTRSAPAAASNSKLRGSCPIISIGLRGARRWVPGDTGGADITAATTVFGTFTPAPLPSPASSASMKAALLQATSRAAVISLADVMKIQLDEVRTLFRLSKPTLVAKATLFKAKQMEAVTRPIPIEEIIDAQADEILSEVYRLDHKDVQAASFVVYDRIEDLLYRGSYDLCDRILRRVAVPKVSTTVMRSLLTITWESRQNLRRKANASSSHASSER